MGKTHLIAALWHASDGPAAYLTFAELTALIGFEGMDDAVAAFAGHRLICLDEFELDDVANTLMTVTFLRRVLAGGGCGWPRPPTPCRTGWARAGSAPRTSSGRSPPSPSTSTSSASTAPTSGPSARSCGRPSTDAEVDRGSRCRRALWRSTTSTTSSPTSATVHPVQYGPLVESVETVVVRDLHPVTNQGDAPAAGGA